MAGNEYIGKTSAGINGAPSVLGYAQNKLDNPYIGQTTQGVTSVPQVGTGVQSVAWAEQLPI
jgi:hypothetical protein